MQLHRSFPVIGAFMFAMPVAAQERSPVSPEAASQSEPTCELHVFPTENYIGFNSGLLSGFGLLGALADAETHKGRVATVKDLMADYLGPEIQMEELNRVGLHKTLGLDESYRIIVEQPTPSADEAKENPAVKAAAKQMNSDVKAGRRLTSSTNPCYAELLLFNIFYHKAMMYGSNLFVGTMFRDFTGRSGAPLTSSGAVKNPLEVFPPRSADMVDAAKAELRAAFSKDFTEWASKKLVKSTPTANAR